MRPGQSKIASLLEAVSNILIGYAIAVTAQIYILPLIGVHIDMRHQLILANYMTVISLARSYALRRFFNWVYVRFS